MKNLKIDFHKVFLMRMAGANHRLGLSGVERENTEQRHNNDAADSDSDSILLAFFLVKVP